MLLSWNPGGGCKRLIPLCVESGYHVVVVQEAKEELLVGWPRDRWAFTHVPNFFCAARLPATVTTMSFNPEGLHCKYHVTEVTWDPPRGNVRTLTICSVHLHNVQAKKKVGGPAAFSEVLQKIKDDHGPIDLLTGDLNMLRLPLSRIGSVCYRYNCYLSGRTCGCFFRVCVHCHCALVLLVDLPFSSSRVLCDNA